LLRPGNGQLRPGSSQERPPHRNEIAAISNRSVNIFNQAQFFGAQSVDGNIDRTTFGDLISTAPPRLVQVGAKFFFESTDSKAVFLRSPPLRDTKCLLLSVSCDG